jgi:DNA-binding NarL/FixJ family response regulator
VGAHSQIPRTPGFVTRRSGWVTQYVGLTTRETQIVVGLTRGLTPKEIASEYRLSVHSVRTYIRRIVPKLPPEYRHIPPIRALSAWGIKFKT